MIIFSSSTILFVLLSYINITQIQSAQYVDADHKSTPASSSITKKLSSIFRYFKPSPSTLKPEEDHNHKNNKVIKFHLKPSKVIATKSKAKFTSVENFFTRLLDLASQNIKKTACDVNGSMRPDALTIFGLDFALKSQGAQEYLKNLNMDDILSIIKIQSKEAEAGKKQEKMMKKKKKNGSCSVEFEKERNLVIYTILLKRLGNRSLYGSVQVDLHLSYIKCIDSIKDQAEKALLNTSKRPEDELKLIFDFSKQEKILQNLPGCKDDPGLKEQLKAMIEAIKNHYDDNNHHHLAVTLPQYRQAIEQIVAQSPISKANLKLETLKVTDTERKAAQVNLDNLFKEMKDKSKKELGSSEEFFAANQEAQKFIAHGPDPNCTKKLELDV